VLSGLNSVHIPCLTVLLYLLLIVVCGILRYKTPPPPPHLTPTTTPPTPHTFGVPSPRARTPHTATTTFTAHTYPSTFIHLLLTRTEKARQCAPSALHTGTPWLFYSLTYLARYALPPARTPATPARARSLPAPAQNSMDSAVLRAVYFGRRERFYRTVCTPFPSVLVAVVLCLLVRISWRQFALPGMAFKRGTARCHTHAHTRTAALPRHHLLPLHTHYTTYATTPYVRLRDTLDVTA